MPTDVYAENDAITFELDGGAVESQDELYSGNRVTKPGYYHVHAADIEHIKFDEEKKVLPHLSIDLVVLDGTGEDGKQITDQNDKAITHRIYLANWEDKAGGVTKPLDEKAQKGVRAFAYAFGLITDQQLAEANVKIPFHLIKGRQAVVKVQQEKDWEKDGKTMKGGLKVSWNNDAWPVTHERVKDVHKNREALSLLGVSGNGSAGGASNSDLADI